MKMEDKSGEFSYKVNKNIHIQKSANPSANLKMETKNYKNTWI